MILLANARPRWVAVSLALLGSAIPIFVAASRVYRGMHYLTDVLAGAFASAIWLTVVWVVLQDGGHALQQARRRNET
jgi:undecaprenyl-diphosphatase